MAPSFFIRCRDTGNQILLILGGNVGADVWEFQVPYLVERGYSCIVYDQRGFGRSDFPSGGLRLQSRQNFADTTGKCRQGAISTNSTQCYRFITAAVMPWPCRKHGLSYRWNLANMRTSRVADRLPSKHDGSSYNRSASKELSGGIAPKIETWNRFPKQ
jgi:pimeloyl-ACP methyl ester carboxylesterase